jgi:SAM-dependent methyltransferase
MRGSFYAEYFALEDWHWWFAGRRRIVLATLDRWLPPAPAPRRILDVGCGTGATLAALSALGAARGVDTDEQAVELSRSRGLSNVEVYDGVTLPVEDGTQDLVCALDVIEHADDDVALLREIRRSLAPGGMAVVTVPAYGFLWGPHDEVVHHRRRYRAGPLRAALRAAGLAVDHCTYFNSILFVPVAAVRLARRHRPRDAEPTSDFALARPGRANDLLARAFAIERWVAPRVRLPFGVSILAVAHAPDRATTS